MAPMAGAAPTVLAAVPTVSMGRLIVKRTLVALNKETGINGGGAAEPDVIAFIADPGGASVELLGRVSSLAVQRWYVDPAKPNEVERGSLWISVRREMDKNPPGANPGGWSGGSTVLALGEIADET